MSETQLPVRQPPSELPSESQAQQAFERLARVNALATLVRGGIPEAVLRRLLKDALPRKVAKDVPPETWSSLAVGIALESPAFGLELADTLHDRLGWDQEPKSLDDWWPAVRERPLEALWMAALSADKTVRKEFQHLARHCLDNYRESPECRPPSWEFVDGVLAEHARQERVLLELQRESEEAARRLEGERERLEELREELRKLRRENGELRAARAQKGRSLKAEQERAEARLAEADVRRFEELERRARKAEKERDHLLAEIERLREAARASVPAPAPAETSAPAASDEAQEGEARIADDPNPRRRVLRQLLKKLFTKAKIGASHTHEDNVYRGVADHEKGLAKDAMDLCYREGWFMPKFTIADPHVSLSPDHLPEIRALIDEGLVENARLRTFIEGE